MSNETAPAVTLQIATWECGCEPPAHRPDCYEPPAQTLAVYGNGATVTVPCNGFVTVRVLSIAAARNWSTDD